MRISEPIVMTNMETEPNGEEPTTTTLHAHQATVGPSGFVGCGGVSGEPLAEDTTPTAPLLCSGCSELILDKYYMWVDKRAWHESCIRCNMCGQTLADSCYMKDFKLYCRQDYKQLQRCKRCAKTIACDELVRRVSDNCFHVACFVCDYCGKQLQSGDSFMTDMICNRICCQMCHDREERVSHVDEESVSGSEKSDDEVFPQPGIHIQQGPPNFQHFVTGDQSHLSLVVSNNKSSSGKNPAGSGALSILGGHPSEKTRPKRPRTILTTAQRRKFKASFEVSQKPCRKIRESLAAETGLTPRVVQVWFQNQRAKVKKMARRQNQEGVGQDSRRGSNKARKNKPPDSDSENELSSPGSYTSMPTPCNPVYTDTYRSPGSVHTSPAAASEHSSSVYFASQQHPESNLMFDGFDHPDLPHGGGMDKPLFTAAGSAASSSSIEAHFVSSTVDAPNDYNNNPSTLVLSDADSVMATSPSTSSFPTYGMGQPITPFVQSQTGPDENPIGRLEFMQNNYFRGWRNSPADCLEN